MLANSVTDDVVVRRRTQLKRWIDTLFAGSQTGFVASTNDGRTQVNQGELSGLLKQKSFGEKRARRLEEQAGMPRGYLDSTASPGQADGSTAREPGPAYVDRNVRWPFTLVTHSRLMALQRSLGPRQSTEVMRELDKYLDAMVSRWEREASTKKKANGHR